MSDLETINQRLDALEDVTNGEVARGLEFAERKDANRERVLGVDPEKVNDALEVTELAESDVYEVDQREYVRKAEVDEEVKETRLQGLKDRLAATESEDAEALRREIEDLEQRIDELTSFSSGENWREPSPQGRTE